MKCFRCFECDSSPSSTHAYVPTTTEAPIVTKPTTLATTTPPHPETTTRPAEVCLYNRGHTCEFDRFDDHSDTLCIYAVFFTGQTWKKSREKYPFQETLQQGDTCRRVVPRKADALRKYPGMFEPYVEEPLARYPDQSSPEKCVAICLTQNYCTAFGYKDCGCLFAFTELKPEKFRLDWLDHSRNAIWDDRSCFECPGCTDGAGDVGRICYGYLVVF